MVRSWLFEDPTRKIIQEVVEIKTKIKLLIQGKPFVTFSKPNLTHPSKQAMHTFIYIIKNVSGRVGSKV